MDNRYKDFLDLMIAKYGDRQKYEVSPEWYEGLAEFIRDNFNESINIRSNNINYLKNLSKTEDYQQVRIAAQREFMIFQLLTPEEFNILRVNYQQKILKK